MLRNRRARLLFVGTCAALALAGCAGEAKNAATGKECQPARPERARRVMAGYRRRQSTQSCCMFRITPRALS